MIQVHPTSHHETLVIHATGHLTVIDYEAHFQPYVKNLIAKHGKINLVIYLDDRFEGWDLGAIWDDAKFGMQHRHDLKRFALVGAQVWFKWAYKVGGKFLDGKFHTFDQDDLAGAVAWAQTPLPQTLAEAKVGAVTANA